MARALLKVMAKRGYDGASIAAIAKTARVAQGLVHYHFKDKREILLLAIEELGARHEERLREHLAQSGKSTEEQLDAFLEAHLGLGQADGEALACWVIVSSEALRERQVGRAFEGELRRVRERLEEILKRGVEEGVFRGDPTVAASALLAVIQGYFVLAAGASELIPRGSALASARAMARGLLQGESAVAVGVKS